MLGPRMVRMLPRPKLHPPSKARAQRSANRLYQSWQKSRPKVSFSYISRGKLTSAGIPSQVSAKANGTASAGQAQESYSSDLLGLDQLPSQSAVDPVSANSALVPSQVKTRLSLRAITDAVEFQGQTRNAQNLDETLPQVLSRFGADYAQLTGGLEALKAIGGRNPTSGITNAMDVIGVHLRALRVAEGMLTGRFGHGVGRFGDLAVDDLQSQAVVSSTNSLMDETSPRIPSLPPLTPRLSPSHMNHAGEFEQGFEVEEMAESEGEIVAEPAPVSIQVQPPTPEAQKTVVAAQQPPVPSQAREEQRLTIREEIPRQMAACQNRPSPVHSAIGLGITGTAHELRRSVWTSEEGKSNTPFPTNCLL